MLANFIKGIAALALAVGTAGCDAKYTINGDEGKRLSELDLAGKAASALVLAGPDTVIVTRGDTLAITVEGDEAARDAVRFTLDDETLGVLRPGKSSNDDSRATVRVTLPSLTKLTLAGSGTIRAPELRGSPEAVIAGSGTADVTAVEADALEVTIAGSGTFKATGTARSLELTVAGSGNGAMEGLRVETADVSIAGSGDAAFASDGTVNAKIMGSGSVNVTGSAKCTVKTMGSGTVTCSAGTAQGQPAASASATPEAPASPAAPGAPPPPAAPTPPPA
jgi:hypothetical protein